MRRHQITPLAEAGWGAVVPDKRGDDTGEEPDRLPVCHFHLLAADMAAPADRHGTKRAHPVAHD